MEIEIENTSPVEIEIGNNSDIEIENDVPMVRGPRGYSAYEVAKQNGYTGTKEEWLESLKGNDGIDGTITFGEISGTTRYFNVKVKGDLPSYAFYNRTDLRKLELSSENIGAYSIYANTLCLNITNDKVIKSLGAYAFYNNSQAEFDIELDDNIETIPNYCFYNDSKLNMNRFPNKLKTISQRAFQNCTNLEIDELPQTLETVATYGLYYCKKITATVCPVITSMGTYAFAYSGVQFREIPEGQL